MKTAILGSAIGGLIVVIIASKTVQALLSEILLWSWGKIVWIWTALESDHLVSGWILLIVGLLAIIGIRSIFGRICIYLLSSEEPKYTEDTLEGVKWRWRWVNNSISDLSCFCPNCDAVLLPFPSHNDFGELESTLLLCEQCPQDKTHDLPIPGRIVEEFGGSWDYLKGKVGREILRRNRTDHHNGEKHTTSP